jgi:hypothetical protein
MDQLLIGLLVTIVGGALMYVGMLVLARAEEKRIVTNSGGAEAEGAGLYLIYAGMAGIVLGIIVMVI